VLRQDGQPVWESLYLNLFDHYPESFSENLSAGTLLRSLEFLTEHRNTRAGAGQTNPTKDRISAVSNPFFRGRPA